MYRGMFLRILAYAVILAIICTLDKYFTGPFGGDEPLNIMLQVAVSLAGGMFVFFSNRWDSKS